MEATSSVNSASTILRVLQSNEAKMHAILKAWRTNVMFERKERKVSARTWRASLLPEHGVHHYGIVIARSIFAHSICDVL